MFFTVVIYVALHWAAVFSPASQTFKLTGPSWPQLLKQVLVYLTQYRRLQMFCELRLQQIELLFKVWIGFNIKGKMYQTREFLKTSVFHFYILLCFLNLFSHLYQLRNNVLFLFPFVCFSIRQSALFYDLLHFDCILKNTGSFITAYCMFTSHFPATQTATFSFLM